MPAHNVSLGIWAAVKSCLAASCLCPGWPCDRESIGIVKFIQTMGRCSRKCGLSVAITTKLSQILLPPLGGARWLIPAYTCDLILLSGEGSNLLRQELWSQYMRSRSLKLLLELLRSGWVLNEIRTVWWQRVLATAMLKSATVNYQ